MRPMALLLLLLTLFQTAVTAAPLSSRQEDTLPQSNENAFLTKTRLMQQKNELLLLSEQGKMDAKRQAAGPSEEPLRLVAQSGPVHPALLQMAQRESAYVLASQFVSPGDPAHGAINNVYGSPTWIVPRENALAIINLIESADITGDASLLDRAALTAQYLARVQDASDGGWYDQYDHANPVAFSKSPTQTAEVMLAYFKLGYDSSLYASMMKGAEYLLACQDPANKTGNDDGLLSGGKDSNGNFTTWRWASDNSFAYQALKAAQAWASATNDWDSANRFQGAAARIVDGINNYLYINDGIDPDFGVWKRAIDGNGVEQEPWFHEWINYAPQMLDVPAFGVGSQRVGEWIHNMFQRADGAVVWNDTWHTTRKSPGFSFQAALVWHDLGQDQYAQAAINWAMNSGLWQTTPDQNGITGGWIDWTEPSDQAPFWQRFIDTSFYAVTALQGGYDFNIGPMQSYELLWMRLQDNDAARADFNLLYGTQIRERGNISDADLAVLDQVVHDPSLNYYTFFDDIKKAAGLYRALQASTTARTDFNLLFGATLAASGAPGAADRGRLFDVTGDPGFVQVVFMPVLTKTADLYRSIRANSTYRGAFNLLYGAALVSTGSPNALDRAALFAIAGDPSFQKSLYLPALTKASDLYKSIRASAVYRADFALLYGTPIPSTGSPSAGARTELFGVVGAPKYVLLSYLTGLRKTSSLYSKLQAQPAKRLSFNSRYGANLPASGAPVPGDRGTLFNITGDPKYKEAAFLASL